MKPDSSQKLLLDLKSRSAKTRDLAAREIMSRKTRGGKDALVEAILNPNNIGHSGILVYALTAFDCSDLFTMLFDLAIFGGFEVRGIALLILDEQKFNPKKIEIQAAGHKISLLKRNEFRYEYKDGQIKSLSRIIRKVSKDVALANP